MQPTSSPKFKVGDAVTYQQEDPHLKDIRLPVEKVEWAGDHWRITIGEVWSCDEDQFVLHQVAQQKKEKPLKNHCWML